jgi:hypothetical protein
MITERHSRLIRFLVTVLSAILFQVADDRLDRLSWFV